MIEFKRHILDNGLCLIIHEDSSTPMAVVNILYKVGSRNEKPSQTGFAHLFEHLMFGGSKNAPVYDEPLQWAGGDCNAFTNSDITNYYDILPAENLETAFWLESDRMFHLKVSKKALETQRKVVTEEYRETCLNEPYGDVMHQLYNMTYQVHPYQWPVIGKEIAHIEQASLDDVQAFFQRYYKPNNAILVVAGNVKAAEVIQLAEKWFGEIPAGPTFEENIPTEPPQTEARKHITKNPVPFDALYMAFHMPERLDPDYYAVDLLSDVLCNGSSSRLYRRLKKEANIFNDIDAYVTGSIDPGLLIIEGHPAKGISLEEARDAVWKELELLKNERMEERELQKLKNKVESTLVYSEVSCLTKAMNLAFFERLGDASLINKEVDLYQRITVKDIQTQANQLFQKSNCSELFYKKKD